MAVDFEEPDSFDEDYCHSRSVSVQCDDNSSLYDETLNRSRSSSISGLIWEWGKR